MATWRQSREWRFEGRSIDILETVRLHLPSSVDHVQLIFLQVREPCNDAFTKPLADKIKHMVELKVMTRCFAQKQWPF
jgi:hypothetical protein